MTEAFARANRKPAGGRYVFPAGSPLDPIGRAERDTIKCSVQFLQQVLKEFLHFHHVAAELFVLDFRSRLRCVNQFELLARIHFGSVRLEDLLRALNGVALIAKQLLDVQDEFDIAVGIDAVAGAVLLRLQLVELRLPVAQHILFEIGDLADFADGIVQFLDAGCFHRLPSCESLRAGWLYETTKMHPELQRFTFPLSVC